MRFLCGDWIVDTAARQLERSGEAAHVSPKAFDLLTTLLRERPRALSKVELRERLWPHTFVSETSLANLIAELRAALGDEAGRPRYIRTVHRHGYAFCGSATEDAEEPPSAKGSTRMQVIFRDREIALTPGTFVNRTRVCGVQPLCDRDEIDLGPERLVFRVHGDASSTQSQGD